MFFYGKQQMKTTETLTLFYFAFDESIFLYINYKTSRTHFPIASICLSQNYKCEIWLMKII